MRKNAISRSKERPPKNKDTGSNCKNENWKFLLVLSWQRKTNWLLDKPLQSIEKRSYNVTREIWRTELTAPVRSVGVSVFPVQWMDVVLKQNTEEGHNIWFPSLLLLSRISRNETESLMRFISETTKHKSCALATIFRPSLFLLSGSFQPKVLLIALKH